MASVKKIPSYAMYIIYINVSLYSLCYQLQRPIEPYLVERLVKGDASTEYARLQSYFSIVQTIGSLIYGFMLDRFGAKGGFIITFISSALCYGCLASATTIDMLYASKIPAIFQGGFLCAQVAASQVTSDGAERVAALGRLTLAYTVGSVLGPALGGYLGASGDYYVGAKFAVLGSILSIILTLFMPNEANKVTYTDKKTESIQKEDSKSESILTVLRAVWLFLFTKLVTGTANSMFATALPLILKNHYQFNENHLGLSMSIMSGVTAVSNGFLLSPAIYYAGGILPVINITLLGMTFLFALQAMSDIPTIQNISMTTLSYSGHFIIFFALTLLLSVLQYILSTSLTGESTARVGPNSKGFLLGLEHSLFAAARIASPQVGVLLLQRGGVTLVSGVCAIVFGAISIVWNVAVEKKDKGENICERKER